ncbi:MAG: hypothetical protein LBQ59_01045 [Candidatus Peribacteria bacterium]|nr:hypothetical protein [Candidatus Peribacteria bacterium]
MEKVITSKSPLTTDNNIVDEETENNKKEFLDSQAEKVFNDLIKTSYFKNLVLERAKESNKTDKEIQELQQELEKMELTKKSLITEYHLM